MFHPKMFTVVEGFEPLDELRSLQFPKMAIDLWTVRSIAGASGDYLSLHPRFVVFFDSVSISLGASPGEGVNCSVCFVPAGLRLWGKVAEASSFQHLDIHIHRQSLEALSQGELDLRRPLFQHASPELLNLCMLLAEECRCQRRPASYAESLTFAAIHEIFHISSKNRSHTHKSAEHSFSSMIEHVRHNLNQPITVEGMGELAGLSRSQFSRKFKTLMGTTPHRWLVEARVEEAKKLMLSGKRFADTAHATGFADQAHFNRCFRCLTGLTPTRWLQRHKAPNGRRKVQD